MEEGAERLGRGDPLVLLSRVCFVCEGSGGEGSSGAGRRVDEPPVDEWDWTNFPPMEACDGPLSADGGEAEARSYNLNWKPRQRE